MSLVDQCPNNSSKMATLSTATLEVFDSYKSQIEDKDSDVESVHLPLTDDEADVSKNGDSSLKDTLNETEDDILNKFDLSVGCSEIDSKFEDTLLDEDNDKTVIENKENAKITKDKRKIKNDKIKETKISKNEVNEKDIKDNNEIEDESVLVANCNKDADNTFCTNKKTNSNVNKDDKLTKHKENDLTTKPDCNEDKELIKEETIRNDESESNDSKDSKSNENKKINENNSNKDKCSNDSPSVSDSEDLLQISVVRDAEEDNAENALDEVNRRREEMEEEDRQANEDDEEGEEGSGKDDNEQIINEEMDIDEDKLILSDDNKTEVSETVMNSVSEEINSEMIRENCDSVNITDIETINDDSNNEEKSEVKNKILNEDKEKNDLNKKNTDITLINSKVDISSKDLTKSQQVTKRPLSSDTEDKKILKKSKLEKNADAKEAPQRTRETLKTKLLCFDEYMKSKNLTKKITLDDLEQFCLQKMCEAIVHQSQLGDLHHQLKLYEQTIETMRREITQLTKQARDLEIVNKKLVNDLKQHNPTQTIPMPLKITRSVGLQVKFTVPQETSVKRKQSNNATVTQTINQTMSVANKLPKNSQNTIPLRQVSSPQKPPQKNPILNQVLTNSRRTSVTSTQLPAKTKVSDQRSGVIDLTDEDDKNKQIATGNRTVVRPKLQNTIRSTFTQDLRLGTAGKVTPITSVVTTSSTPQLMYVVQPVSSNQKTVFVNLQPTNGVLTTSSINGQPVSVIPKQGNTIQLKTVVGSQKQLQSSKIIRINSKHPAPLPTPPQVRMNGDRSLKSIPPKPILTIRKTDNGIILQWKMPYDLEMYEPIASYQLYAYQETTSSPSTEMWRRVGDVKALALPMACTLTQFADKNKYYFAVRPVDIHKRIGAFSDPEEISL